MLLPQWQTITIMADRMGTEIESDSEKAEVKMTNSARDVIVEYAIHYAPTHQTSQRRRRELSGRTVVVLTAIIIKGFVTAVHVQVLVTSIGDPNSCCQRGSKCCSETVNKISSRGVAWSI